MKSMEITCEKCRQEEGQIKKGRTKAESQRCKCTYCEKTYTHVKKRGCIQKAKRPDDRTEYKSQKQENRRANSDNKQEYVFEVVTEKS